MIRRYIVALLCLLSCAVVLAQEKQVEVDYNHPRKYFVGGVEVEGNSYFSSAQIIQLTGMQKGMELTVPSDDVSGIVRRLWLQRYFEDVSLVIDHLSENADSAYFKIIIKERPRVSRWTFSGIKSGDKKELQDRLNLRRGGEFSEYVEKTSSDIIKRYYAEKGFLNATVQAEVQKDSIVKNAIRVNFAINRGERVRIKEIHFIGNEHVGDFKLARSMKKTKSNKIYNFFNSKKFNEKEYLNDKKTVLSAFNEAGYRDARLVRDSVYYMEPNRLAIDLVFEEGDKYYFRDITWTGNSVYPSEVLNEVLKIQKGDVYDVVSMEKRLNGGGKQTELDVSKLYRDNGYLFFNVTPVETNIQNDSVDVELRISEGKQATLNNIVINGNDLTNEKVVRRQIFTRPGYLFRQSDFERSIREIASLGQFDPEAIQEQGKGYSIIPNQLNNTVDIVYNVTEKPSSQLELRQDGLAPRAAGRRPEPGVPLPDQRPVLHGPDRQLHGALALRQEAYLPQSERLLHPLHQFQPLARNPRQQPPDGGLRFLGIPGQPAQVARQLLRALQRPELADLPAQGLERLRLHLRQRRFQQHQLHPHADA